MQRVLSKRFLLSCETLGRETEEHLKKFYGNKIFDQEGMRQLGACNVLDKGRWSEFRRDVVERSIVNMIHKFDLSRPSSFFNSVLAFEWFPSFEKCTEGDPGSYRFLTFMVGIGKTQPIAFSGILCSSKDPEKMLSFLENFIQEFLNEDVGSWLLHHSLYMSERLFLWLQDRGWLDWNSIKESSVTVGHVAAIRWCEQNGVDFSVSKNFEVSLETMEYIMSKEILQIEYIERPEVCKLMLKLKGLEAVQEKFHSSQITFDFDTVKLLRSAGYRFDKREILKTDLKGHECYGLMCFDVLKYEDLKPFHSMRNAFEKYTKQNDLKACTQMYPFMKEVR